jgi:hypothetical protein
LTLTPPEVLYQLHAHGVTARITSEGCLRIEPVSQLPVELVDAVRADPTGVADEILRGWIPEGEGWERVFSDVPSETIEDKRRLLVFRQVASLPTARNLARQDDTYVNLYRVEIERWREDERRLRAEGFQGCIGATGYPCPPDAPVLCQTCVWSGR